MAHEPTVSAIYSAVLRTEPTEAQIAFYAAQFPATDPNWEEDLIDALLPLAQDDVYAVVRLYQASFDRLPDSAGLDFWVASYNTIEAQAGTTAALESLAAGFATSAEFMARYQGLNNEQIVSQLYMNVLNRAGDAGGIDYWTDLLNGGADLSAVVNGFAQSAEFQGRSATFIEAFLTLAAENTFDGDDTNNDAPYQGSLFDVPGGEPSGSIFTLTNTTNVTTGGVDTVNGSESNDTIRALLTDSLDDTDIIDGKGGNDTLTIDADGVVDGSAPVIKNVETINNADAGFDLANVTGTTRINSSASANYTNAALATTFAATAAVTVGIDYADAMTGDTTASVATALTTTGTATFEFGADATGIENVNLDVADADGVVTTVALDTDLDTLESITVTGAGDVVLASAAEATLETFNAGSATGSVTVDLSAATDLKTVSTGSGGDTVTLGGQDDLTVTLGAGNDVLNVAGTEAGLKATLGAGNDAVVFAAVASNIDDADEADFAADIIAIADFNGSQDLLDLGGATVVSLNNIQQGDIEDETSLFDAVTKASTYTNAAVTPNEAVVFEFSGNTYVYVDNDDDQAFSTGDGLIELTGFTGDFTGSNFIA